MLQNTVNAQYTVLWIILSPLFGALLTPLKRIMRVLYYAALFGITLSNIASLVFHGYDTQPIRFGTWFIFSLDVYSMAFAVLLNVCWALTVIYSHDYMRYEFQKRAVYFCKVFSAALSLIVATGLPDKAKEMLEKYEVAGRKAEHPFHRMLDDWRKRLVQKTEVSAEAKKE